MIMCRACGNFQRGRSEDETVVPVDGECHECGATKFKDVR